MAVKMTPDFARLSDAKLDSLAQGVIDAMMANALIPSRLLQWPTSLGHCRTVRPVASPSSFPRTSSCDTLIAVGESKRGRTKKDSYLLIQGFPT
jgi:hypothetical protein